MKEFLQRKKSIIGKFTVNQIAFSIFGIMVSSSVLVFNEKYVLLAGVFSALFYLTLIFSSAYYDGQKDAISIEGGRMKCVKLSGLYYALVQYIPTIIITVLNVVLRLFDGGNILESVVSFLNIITRFFTMGMYIGIDIYFRSLENQSLINLSNMGILFLAFLVIYPFASCLGYFCGLKNIHLFKRTEQ